MFKMRIKALAKSYNFELWEKLYENMSYGRGEKCPLQAQIIQASRSQSELLFLASRRNCTIRSQVFP